MAEIGVRELKIHASEIVRAVKEKHARYIITHRGRPVATIIPVEDVQPGVENAGSAWDELTTLGEQISQNWQSPETSTEILANLRR